MLNSIRENERDDIKFLLNLQGSIFSFNFIKILEKQLSYFIITNFKTENNFISEITLSYEIFGEPLHSAPIILVNHALTGNSSVSGKNGWWSNLIGKNKPVNTDKFTIICFNIPGNGYDGFFIKNYKNFTTKDIAKLFLLGLNQLKISKLHTIIGGSIGGAIGWEMLALKNHLTDHFIPIATDFKTTDWLHSQCLIQEFLLNQNDKPLQKARIHAMLCYRTPQSLNERFQNEKDTEKGISKSQDWLEYHGKALNERFSLKSYRLMNHLLKTINADFHHIQNTSTSIHLVSVDSDLFFPAFEIRKTFHNIKQYKENVFYHEIKSIHGHDAFLIEYEQLQQIINKIIE